MLYFFWLLFVSTGAFGNDLFSVDIYRSSVYTSSVAPGSQPRFAVDNDLLEERPTCFQTNNDQPDADGQHWLLIDFGYALSNIKEIRVVTESGYNLSNLSAYTIRKPNLSLQQLVNTSRERPALNLHTRDAVLCSSTGQVEPWRTATSILCHPPRDGRWLAIRQTGGMHICMINVYVTQAYSMCFDRQPVTQAKTLLTGVFRLIRHLTLGACRAACMGSPECHGLMYARRSRSSGNCHLIRPKPEAVADETTGDEVAEERFDSICRRNMCTFEVNRCQAGRRFDLKKKSDDRNSAVELTHQLVDFSLEQTEDWMVSTPNSSSYEFEKRPRYLISVHLQGHLTCDAWDCGLLRISAVQADGYEAICGEIDTVSIHVLDSFPILCDAHGYTVPANTSAVRLAWKAWPKSDTGEIVKLDVKVLGGHVRMLDRPPARKPRVSVTTPAPVDDWSPDGIKKPVTEGNIAEMNDDEYTLDPVQLDQQLFSSLRPVAKTTQMPRPNPDISSVSKPATEMFRTIDSIQLTGREVLVNDRGYETRKHNLYRKPAEETGSDTKVYGKRGLPGKKNNNTLSRPSHIIPSVINLENSLGYSRLMIVNTMLVLIPISVDILY